MTFSCADYTFPLVPHDDALRLIRILGVGAVDVGLFANRSHLRPESIGANPGAAGQQLAGRLKRLGLELADVFVQFGPEPSCAAANDPDPSVRRRNREAFTRAVEFVHAAGARHMTGLPGVPLPHQLAADGIRLAADDAHWRLRSAREAGITYAIEPHVGSNCGTVAATLALLGHVPGLTLTFDPGHFIYQGETNANADLLAPYASHFHARCGAPGKLQARMPHNRIDFAVMVERATSDAGGGDAPRVCLEYVWVDWEGCNEVDNVAETLLLKAHLESLVPQRADGGRKVVSGAFSGGGD